MTHSAEYIQQLLDRYWDGETSLEEERTLKTFFASGPVPAQFQQEADLFRALISAKQVEMASTREIAMPARPMARFRWLAAACAVLVVSAGIWWWQANPAAEVPGIAGAVVPEKPVEVPKQATVLPAEQVELRPAMVEEDGKKTHKLRFQRSKPKQEPPAQPQMVDDPEKALAEIKAALALVSSKIRKGKKEVEKGLQEIETLDKVVRKKSEG